MAGFVCATFAFSQPASTYYDQTLQIAQEIWGEQVRIDKGTVYYGADGKDAVYGFTVLLNDKLNITPAEILTQVAESRATRLSAEQLLDEGRMEENKNKIAEAGELIAASWANMRQEQNFATLFMKANVKKTYPVKFYKGLPPHYVMIFDAKEIGIENLKTESVATNRFLYDGLFEFFAEFVNGEQRTVVDLLYPEDSQSQYSVNDLLSAFAATTLKPKENLYTNFCESAPIRLYKPPPDDIITKIISGVPDYQTIYPRGCAPAASGCVLGYWDDHGYSRMVDGGGSGHEGHRDPNGEGYLHLIWDELATAMNYVQGFGTYVYKVDDGIFTVANINNGYSFTVSNGTWYSSAANDRSTYHGQINGNKPFVYTLKHILYGGGAGFHTTTAAGYQIVNIDGPNTLYYRIVHDNNTGTGKDVYLSEDNLIGSTHIITVQPGGTRALRDDYRKRSNVSLAAYPNPFNPTTTIAYSLDHNGKVSLHIYNTLGQRIMTFDMGVQSAGAHSLSWDGHNQTGEEVAAGTYLVELRTKEQRVVKKIALVK